jgi:hypothetical protein
MTPIDVTNTKHLAFLNMMGFGYQLWHKRDSLDSCMYWKMLFWASVQFAILMAAVFFFAFWWVWGLITAVILITHGIFLDGIPNILSDKFTEFSYVFWLTNHCMVAMVVFVLAIFYLKDHIVKKYRERACAGKYTKNGELVEPIPPSAFSKLYDSLKNKYCVPVKAN